MSESVNKETVVQDVLNRIKELKENRELLAQKENELESHVKELGGIKVVKGEDSDEYRIKKEIIDVTEKEINDIENIISKLSFRKSELKPIFDEVAKKFEYELRAEQERDFHVEVGPEVFTTIEKENGEEDEVQFNEINQKAGRTAFRRLLDYLYKDVKWGAKTAPGLLVLVRNMEENKEWVRSKEFDNIIKLRSSNVLVLWKSILEDMEGKGFYEAKTFLECWANCGKGISEAVREIQKLHEQVRILGTQLNTIEDEYLRSEDDLNEEEITVQEEVNPEV